MQLPENERFSLVIMRLKATGEITSGVELATQIKCSKSHISDIRRGKAPLTKDFIARIKAEFPSVNDQFLLSGIGKALLSDTDAATAGITASLAECVTYYTDIKAFITNTSAKELMYLPLAGGGIAFPATANTMEPIISAGATIVTEAPVDAVGVIENGSPYLIIAEGISVVRLCTQIGDVLELATPKGDVAPIQIPVQSVQKIARVCYVLHRI